MKGSREWDDGQVDQGILIELRVADHTEKDAEAE